MTRCRAPVSTSASVSSVCTCPGARCPSCARTSSRVLRRVTGTWICPTRHPPLRHRRSLARPLVLGRWCWGVLLLFGERLEASPKDTRHPLHHVEVHHVEARLGFLQLHAPSFLRHLHCCHGLRRSLLALRLDVPAAP